jgi:predicted DNA-binding protein with PD1-like motif
MHHLIQLQLQDDEELLAALTEHLKQRNITSGRLTIHGRLRSFGLAAGRTSIAYDVLAHIVVASGEVIDGAPQVHAVLSVPTDTLAGRLTSAVTADGDLRVYLDTYDAHSAVKVDVAKTTDGWMT